MTPDEVQLWNGMSAEQARANGMAVPDTVPDCATLTLDMVPGSVQVVDEGNRLATIKFTVQPKWSWVTITGTIDTSEST